MAKTGLMSSALSAAFIASIGFATPAHALEPKQCLPMAEMNAALKAEGQRTMIIGDREARPTSPTGKVSDTVFPRWMNTVTSNADGSLGYQLEGDKPRAETSTKVCVASKLTNVHIFDARKPGLPKEALLGGDFDLAIRNSEKHGTRPMVVADTVHRDANGTERLGLPIVLLGNMDVKGGYLVTRLANGRPLDMMQMADTEYTAAGLARLNPQVAMISPK